MSLPLNNCKYLGICGGCENWHLNESDYIKWKLNTLEEELKIRNIEYKEEIKFYIQKDTLSQRRRVIFTAEKNGKNVVLGFNKQKTHDVVDINRCEVINEEINDIIIPIKDCLSKTDFKRIRLIITYANGSYDIGFIGKITYLEKHSVNIINKIQNIGRIWHMENDDSAHKIILSPSNVFVLWNNKKVELPIGAFLQPSIFGENILQDFVLEHAVGSKKIAELYSGFGTLTSVLVGKYKVDAYEMSDTMVESLKKRGINATVRMLDKLPLIPKELNNYDTVVLDPPRVGAYSQVKQIAISNSIKKVIMISCNAKTFGIDAKNLVQSGFKLSKLEALDQFPYTKHLEVLSCFTR